MLPMLRSLLDDSSDRAIWFVHATRNDLTHAMRDEVRSLRINHPNLRTHFVYSQPRVEDRRGTTTTGRAILTSMRWKLFST